MRLLGVFILRLYSTATSKNNPLNKNYKIMFPSDYLFNLSAYFT